MGGDRRRRRYWRNEAGKVLAKYPQLVEGAHRARPSWRRGLFVWIVVGASLFAVGRWLWCL